MADIQKLLQERPDVEGLYFNEDGKFSFSVSKLHPIYKTREQLLAGVPFQDTPIDDEDLQAEVQEKKSKKK